MKKATIKRIFVLLLSLTVSLSMLNGCGNDGTGTGTDNSGGSEAYSDASVSDTADISEDTATPGDSSSNSEGSGTTKSPADSNGKTVSTPGAKTVNSMPKLTSEPVTITIAGSWADCKAVETVGAMFTKKYPNCTVVYESVNDYYVNLPKRMKGDEVVDLFFVPILQNSSQDSSGMLPYALDLNSAQGLDFSDTFSPLKEHCLFREDKSKMYSITLGAEMRGMFVNKTLLKSVGITKIPSKQSELLTACRILKSKGYIPMQGNPTDFGQWLMMPWIFNNIANASNTAAAKEAVNSKNGAYVRNLLKEPFQFLYNLSANYYYDYKTSQKSLNLFNDSTEEDHARYFLNIVKSGTTYKQKDKTAGQVAFMPAPMSYIDTMNKTKEDYRSSIEYTFIPAPVGTDGGYVYLSPAHSIAINKYSKNLGWTETFLNFLFTAKVNTAFSKDFNIMPNVKKAFSYISSLYDVPQDHIIHIGQTTFDWGFYETCKNVIIETSKANKPDTVAKNGGKLHTYNYYMDLLESRVNAGN